MTTERIELRTFGRGVPYVVYRLKAENGLDVPVVPMSVFGSHRPWGIPGRILVNIGRPLRMGHRPGETVDHLLWSAIQQAKDSIIITTANPVRPTAKIVFVNPAFTKMTGYRLRR